MKSVTQIWLTLSLFFCLLSPQLQAQVQETDTLKKYQDSTLAPAKVPFFKSKGFKATVVPAVLIGYGISTMKDHGIYSSYDAKRDLQRNFPNFKTKVDDYLIFAPFVELALAYSLQFEGNHDYLNTGILILKAEAINAVMVFGLKSITKQERPNGENSYSFPSGHTAHAFLAASIIHSELRHRSQWFGIGAYTIATGVGALRMLNNKHWQSDVFAGAGVGILSSHLAYLSHRNRWGRKPTIVFAPTYLYGVPGINLTINLDPAKSKNKFMLKRSRKQTPLAYK
ncbi:phosphatase PAP2 family protein [Adhaeribacter radiodurans]|uniref:Phosphatase PAP2 family protein n=1 Tax=Adhaeribacter radiodurans TaxID=2745197 RepID=A0A7L7LC07_9BACT|nr:phosphatase PAP2 family protein [Adhaeribacter radiodurans]QMU30351.1 phosphatase PAP2 family protein [Adhaeribacter radiodurans]